MLCGRMRSYAHYVQNNGRENMTTKEHTLSREFEHAKETKGTHQYREVGDDVKIGTIYLKKHALTDGVPDTIMVRVVW